MRRLLIIIMSFGLMSGCAHVIAKDVLRQVDTGITFADLRKAPQAFQGKVVLLGGVIVKVVNKKDGTLLEIYQTEIDGEGRPLKLDVSEGRFLALHTGFLDSEIYSKGRKVTVVGTVQGEQTLKLGEIDYRYPSLLIKELYLWKKEQLRYEPYPWGPWDSWWYSRNPWHPWYHWYDPYWHHPLYRR